MNELNRRDDTLNGAMLENNMALGYLVLVV